MKIVQVIMKCELPAGEKGLPTLRNALDGLNRLGLQYQLTIPPDLGRTLTIAATGQSDKVEAALRLYGAILSTEAGHEHA